MVRQEYPHPKSSSNNTWCSSGKVCPPSRLALMVIMFRCSVELGFEKRRISLPSTLLLAFTAIRLAMQTGSCKTLLDDGCSVHVLPKSLVTDTALLPLLLSRMFSISTPGSTSATCASVVLDRAGS